MSSPTLPTAITGLSVSRLVQPAMPRSEPSHSGIQNLRAEAWKTSTPAVRSMSSMVFSSWVVSTTRVLKLTSFHWEKRKPTTKSGPVAARTAATISAGKRTRSMMSPPP